MAQPRKEDLVTALDIGSSKVSALIAERNEGNEPLTVLGTGQRESRGVRRGYIADMDATERAVREAVEQAEKIAGLTVEDVWVSFSAGGLVSKLASVETNLGGHRIEQTDIDDLLAHGRSSIDPEGRMVLHAQPTLYTLDGLRGVKKPLGLHADSLGVDIHVVAAEPSPIRNLDLCVRSAHLEVKAIVAAPVAAGMAVLGEEERELGVALVELGAGVTNVSLWAGGLLVGLKSIPFGAADITDDIASAFATRRAQAERLKCRYGSATPSPKDNHEMIEVSPREADGQGADMPRITRAALIAVIRSRLEQIMGEVGAALTELGFTGPIGRQVVLTGGGAELKGMADYAQAALGRVVRVGRPKGVNGLPEPHSGPAFAALVGLAAYAASDPVDVRAISVGEASGNRPKGDGIFGRLISAFRSGY